MSHVSCTKCVKRVSNDVVGDLIIRAYVECPECVESGECESSDSESNMEVDGE